MVAVYFLGQPYYYCYYEWNLLISNFQHLITCNIQIVIYKLSYKNSHNNDNMNNA